MLKVATFVATKLYLFSQHSTTNMYFNLKEPNKDKDTLIILRYYISKKEGRFVYSTGENINPKDWNKIDKTAKNIRGRSDLRSINRKLEEYSSFLEKTLLFFELNNLQINKNILKIKFDEKFNPNKSKATKFIYFTEFVEDFILRAPNLINRVTKQKYNSIKIGHYKKTNNRVKEFEEYRMSKIRLDSFTLDIYDELVLYLKDKRGYATNTVGDLIKNIKKFLNVAEDFKYKIHADYKKSSFTVLKEESISIVLNETEINKLLHFDFSNNKRLENCRDIAIIGLWTGLRVSDFLSLPIIKLEEDFITVQPKKTKESSGIKVVIPLHHNIKEVIVKRGMPKMISDVKFNEYIKEICLEIGMTQKVKGSLMNPKTNRKEVGFYPKYKLVSSHICRRSFATNLYKMNFPTLSIMNITGHTTEKSFLKYIKVTPTEHAEKLLAHWKAYYNN